MRDFTNELVDLIIEQESDRLNKIMKDVTENVMKDFAKETYKLLDEYYDNYTPIRYVRVYGGARKLRTKSGTTKRKPRGGQVSLHAAITRGGEDAPAIGVAGGDYYSGYIGGIVLDESKFKENGMRHIGKGNGFSEWNIVQNFMFTGDGGYGDWRSTAESGWSGVSADTELNAFMNSYDSTLDMHYENALKKFK